MISSHDVIVVGAGPAGIGAALAAARNGARTLLIEDSGMAGGCWTLGLQNHVTCMHDHRKLIIHGIALELMQRLAAAGEAEEPEEKLRRLPRTWYCAFDPEGLKYTLDQMLLESGVEILYHTRCVDTVCDAGGRVTGVVTESKSGRRSFTARIVADCSGDADAAAFAGAATRKGRDSDGRMQPATTAFMLANVDYDRAAAHLAAHPGFTAECEAKARKLGELDMPISPYPGCRTMIDGVTYHNMTRITGIDGTRAEDLTRAEIEGRRQARLMAAFFRKYIPGFERSALIATGSVGLRETRRLCGVKTLTREDVMSARKFPDAIASHAYYIDMHNPDGGFGGESSSGDAYHPEEGDFYQIPYGCLIPERVDGLLVAGRCISADRAALGSVRTTACCVALGQAAGTAAALCVKAGIEPRNLDPQKLRALLLEQNVFL